MPGLPDCPGCEYRDDPDQLCWCAANGFVGICDGVNGKRGDHRVKGMKAIVRFHTVGEPLPMEAEPPRIIVTGEPIARVTVQQAVLRLKEIEACPDRGAKIGDGCDCLYACNKGHGSGYAGEVSLYDCQDCLDGNPRVPASGKRAS